MRIYEYAKKSGMDNKQVLDALENCGIPGKKASSGLTVEELRTLDGAFTGTAAPKQQNIVSTENTVEAKQGNQQASTPVRRVTIGLDTKHRYDSRKILEINSRLSKAHEGQAAQSSKATATGEREPRVEAIVGESRQESRPQERVEERRAFVPNQDRPHSQYNQSRFESNDRTVQQPRIDSRMENKVDNRQDNRVDNRPDHRSEQLQRPQENAPRAASASTPVSQPRDERRPSAPISYERRVEAPRNDQPRYDQNRVDQQRVQNRPAWQNNDRSPRPQQTQQYNGERRYINSAPGVSANPTNSVPQGPAAPTHTYQRRYDTRPAPSNTGWQNNDRRPMGASGSTQGNRSYGPGQNSGQYPNRGSSTGGQSNYRPQGQQGGYRPAFGANRGSGGGMGDKDADLRPQNNSNFKRPVKPAASGDAAPAKVVRKNNTIDKTKKFGDRREKRTENASKIEKHYRDRGRGGKSSAAAPAQKIDTRPKNIKILGNIAVNEFASKMGVTSSQVIMKLMRHGIMATLNQEIDLETAMVVGEDFGVTVEELPPEADPTEIIEISDDAEDMIVRPPVVTVMGHVDHGKTSLLDAIRSARVVAGEAGGITQHIGAYQVNCHNKKITFLDTPGHEAFTAMRARGAQATDIAILVVAADDGVMPQTIEAINHAKAAKVPIIVAINKMDKESAQPDRVKQQLTEYGLQSEDWGGDTIMVQVSAQKKTGINELLEMILLVAEMNDLRANPNRAAQGIVIEAQLDKGRGPVATVLIQKGTLHIGDSVIVGSVYGNVRAMFNDSGERIKKAGPAVPVEILGLNNVPEAGDTVLCVDDKIARAVAEKRLAKRKLEEQRATTKVSLDDLFKQIQDGNLKDLNIVVKADVQGSVEALRQSLVKISNEEVRVNVIHSGAGAITESDINLAAAANALIIGFNVRPDNNARKAAEEKDVDIRLYRVIYDAINDVETAMKGMLKPEFKEVALGKLEIRKVYDTSKGIFAGCYVLEGKATNQSSVRLYRDNVVIYEGKVDSLRRFKDDVKEVAAGYECGVVLTKFREIKEGDVLEVFIMEEIKR